jgi:phosphoribosyl 1,2-cyclic phosphodiesterase
VTPFTKKHDAGDPHSFVVGFRHLKVGVFTDLGVVCKALIAHFKQCHAAFLESNYDERMLEEGGYPIHLKNRIRGGLGHLSNRQALALVQEHRPAFMTHLLLSHLSKNNNDPLLVERIFTELGTPTKVVIASRYCETQVFHITSPELPAPSVRRQSVEQVQLSLF